MEEDGVTRIRLKKEGVMSRGSSQAYMECCNGKQMLLKTSQAELTDR